MTSYSLVKTVRLMREGEFSYAESCCFMHISKEQFMAKERILEKKLMPYKSIEYYVNRYFNHPVYNYKFVLIKDSNNEAQEVFVYRVCNALNRKYIFVVDYIGNGENMRGAYRDFCSLLDEEDAECISFPCEGIDESFLISAGFRVRDDANIVLPVYFEPFVCKNVDLDYHFWPGDKKYVIVKGDADQDRPNQILEEMQ